MYKIEVRKKTLM